MEHIALYRQFRPMTFDEMVEQEAAVTTLRQAVITGKIGHAYLFCGQRGTGKTSIARVFARAINCEHPVNGNPCNSCPTCKGILDGSLMDVIEIDAASNTSVENIKKICEEVVYAPSKAPYKVYIIDEVHMLSKGASNALLKTLEEPPRHAVFLFATTEIHKILPTIISRCQRYDFRRITSDAIVKRLEGICSKEKIKADREALVLIASLSDGALRDALSLLDQASSCANGETITAKTIEDMTGSVNNDFLADMADAIIKAEYDKLLVLCGKLAESGKDTVQFTLDLSRYFRDLLVVRVIRHPAGLIKGSAGTIRRMYDTASLTNADTLVAFITFLSKLVSELKWSPSPRTSFEISMLRLAGRKVKAEIKPLVMPEELKGGSDVKLPPILASKDKEEKKEDKKDEKKTEEKPSSDTASSASSSVSDIKSRLDILKRSSTATPAPSTTATSASPFGAKPEAASDKAPSAPAKEEPASSLPPIARLASSDEKKEEKKDAAPSPSPFSTLLSSVKKDADKAEPAKKEDLPPLPLPASPAPEEEEKDPEDIPMDNQIDIFSMGSQPAKKEEKKEAPAPSAKEEKKEPDDLPPAPWEEEDGYNDEPAEEPEYYDDQHVPTGRIGETRKSSLAVAVEETPIATRRTPADPYEVWDGIIMNTSAEDPQMGDTLRQCGFKVEDDSVYMVFPNEMSDTVKALRSNARYKAISSELKEKIAGAAHIYLCTDIQYANAMALAGKKPSEEARPLTPEEKMQELLKRGEQMGIATEIHFGDD